MKKAAKYRVKREAGDWVVQLQYELDHRSTALLTTKEHPDLIEMVNRVKEVVNDAPGGAFYINEYGQVLVTSTSTDYFVAGLYDECLEFDFDGEIISCRPPETLAPGELWDGPHVGIPYTLTAAGDDIRYSVQFANVVEKHHLSDDVGEAAARELAQRLARHKRSGGRIYINECREFFAPVDGDDGWQMVYLGPLGSDVWFSPRS